MEIYEKIKEYCDKVEGQIRWKSLRLPLIDELKSHIYDQRDEYMAQGDDESCATQRAIMQMGDPVTIGRQLDKAHRPKPQLTMWAITIMLMAIGIGFNYFLSAGTDGAAPFNAFNYVIALGIFIGCYYTDFSFFERNGKVIYIANLALSLVALLSSQGIGGRSVWVIGQMSMTLSYMALIFPIIFALFAYSMREKGAKGGVISLIAYIPLAVILMILPTISGLILYTITAVFTMVFGILRGWFGVDKGQVGKLLLSTFAIPTCLIGGMLAINPYFLNRLGVFLNPQQDRMGSGYLYILIRNVMENSVFLGEGSANGEIITKISTDYSLVYLIHKFGFAILLGVILVLVAFSAIAMIKALKEKSQFASLIGLTVTMVFILQWVFYIADNLGYGLVSSLSLPFISYGNSALFINSMLTGLMLSVFRTGESFRLYGNKAKLCDNIVLK